MTGRTGTRSAPRSRGGGARLAPGGTGAVSGTAAPGLARSPGQSRAPAPVPPIQNRGTDMAGQWPIRDFLELGALPGAVPSARLHARSILWEWSLTPLTEAVEQVVSELITNSVAAARAMPQTGPVRLWLLTDTRKVLVLAWDANPQPPALTDAGPDAENGRGLLLVQAFSDHWGTYPTPQMGGKIVWALCGTNTSQQINPPR
jgi:anti-sigma regulatory factor (Ser/Thr protein kinase)